MPRRGKDKPLQQTAAQKAEHIVEGRTARGIGTSTAERIVKTGAPADIAQSGTQLVMDWPLHVLYLRGSLGKADQAKARYDAGRRFHEHHYLGQLAPAPKGVDLNSVGGGLTIRGPWASNDIAQRHREMFRSAQAALGGDRTATLTAMVVLNEIGLIDAGRAVYARQHEGQVRALATEGLKDGLDRLSKHFERPPP